MGIIIFLVSFAIILGILGVFFFRKPKLNVPQHVEDETTARYQTAPFTPVPIGGRVVNMNTINRAKANRSTAIETSEGSAVSSVADGVDIAGAVITPLMDFASTKDTEPYSSSSRFESNSPTTFNVESFDNGSAYGGSSYDSGSDFGSSHGSSYSSGDIANDISSSVSDFGSFGGSDSGGSFD